MRLVNIVVATDGSITEGSGATVNKSGTGQYAITYDTMFGSPPGVSATPWGGGAVSLNIFADNTCQVSTTDLSGNAVDGGFAFTAIGE